MAEKVSHFLYLLMHFLIHVAMPFYYGWKLSVIVLAYVPIAFVTNAVIEKVSGI